MFPIEAFRDTLGKAVAIFEQHSIRFHLTGGITSVFYGEPRMTQDIDIVVDNAAIVAQQDAFLSSLERSDFVFDASTVRRAISQSDMFQLFDKVEALKLDIYPRGLIPGELDRSQLAEVFTGVHLPVASRADVAASKLVWISKGNHKSRRDLRQMFRVASADDRALIRDLANRMGLQDLLEEVLKEPDELRG
jgi:hypothetical protein